MHIGRELSSWRCQGGITARIRPAGWDWYSAQGATSPRYLGKQGGAWQQLRHGCWQALNDAEPACHVSYFEADAWCRWAGRRLPTEAEWERAAVSRSADFCWGHVWEWTASPFQPFPGFAPHPYRDYSAPWFDGRPVLRGASYMTQARVRWPRYRNFFPPQRNDIAAGFRTCELRDVVSRNVSHRLERGTPSRL